MGIGQLIIILILISFLLITIPVIQSEHQTCEDIDVQKFISRKFSTVEDYPLLYELASQGLTEKNMDTSEILIEYKGNIQYDYECQTFFKDYKQFGNDIQSWRNSCTDLGKYPNAYLGAEMYNVINGLCRYADLSSFAQIVEEPKPESSQEIVCGPGTEVKDGKCVPEQITLSAYDTSPEKQKKHAERCGIEYNPNLRITFNPNPPPYPGCFFDTEFGILSFNEAVEFYGANQIVCLEPLIYRPELNGCWGTKEAQEELIEKHEQSTELICGPGTIKNEKGQCVPERATMTSEMQQKSSNGGGCLIATATFGTELAPQVQQLRELRDNYLMKTESGQSFMQGFNEFYYSFSPAIADYERENPVFKEAVKIVITPLITSLSILNYVDMESEAQVLGYGISLILLNVGMYVVVPLGISLVLVRNFQIVK